MFLNIISFRLSLLIIVSIVILVISIILTINLNTRYYGISLIILTLLLTSLNIYQIYHNSTTMSTIENTKLQKCNEDKLKSVNAISKIDNIYKKLLNFLSTNKLFYNEYYDYLDKYMLLQQRKIYEKDFQNYIQKFNFSSELQQKIKDFYNEMK